MSPENDPIPGRVLVTSGPTRAWIDRVRYIANTSTGALGAHIVEALIERGIQSVTSPVSGRSRPRYTVPRSWKPSR